MAIVQRSLLLAVGLAFILSGCGSTATNEETLYAIGDTGPAGGLVFKVTDGGLHGLEMAPVDQSIPLTPGVPWGCEDDVMDTIDGSGAANTQKILAGCAEPGIAARVAANYSLNGYTDWFLPSEPEMALITANLGSVFDPTNAAGFAENWYWSSTELSSRGIPNGTLARNPYAGTIYFVSKNVALLYGVRAVHEF